LIRSTSGVSQCCRRPSASFSDDVRPSHCVMPGRLLSAPSVAFGSSSTARVICQNTGEAFISCRLDYCNALLYGISDSLFKRLQSIQNAAARILTGASRRDHISPVLRSLHWFPVKLRVEYKLATLVYKSLRSQAPSYLVDDCQLIADSGRLRSRQRPHCSENKHLAQEFLGRGSQNLEQSTRLTAAA